MTGCHTNTANGCHTNTATVPLSACHKLPVKTLPIQANLRWSLLPHVPLYGLQIGKDQKGGDQRDENGYPFYNIGFIDDISIFADTPEGMQELLNVVQEFMAWCGMQINVKITYLLVIDNDKNRREQEPAPLLTMNGETLQAMNLDDACRYLGYWGAGNGDMRATKEVVSQKIIDVT